MLNASYQLIKIFTSESAQWHHHPLYEEIVRQVASTSQSARCVVHRGVSGCFEHGVIATRNILALSMNMPLTIEIILPSSEVQQVLETLQSILTDGIIAIEPIQVVSVMTHKENLTP
jgi:PII-like signaling protein